MNNKGFTMIELLMVMIIVGNLSVSAFGTYVDFRNEARNAATAYAAGNVRSAIRNMKIMARMNCDRTEWYFQTYTGGLPGSYAVVAALTNNDVTAASTGPYGPQAVCTADQVPITANRKLIAADSIPVNPYTNSRGVLICNSSSRGCAAVAGATGFGYSAGNMPSSIGWCYNTVLDDFYAVTNNNGECNL